MIAAPFTNTTWISCKASGPKAGYKRSHTPEELHRYAWFSGAIKNGVITSIFDPVVPQKSAEAFANLSPERALHYQQVSELSKYNAGHSMNTSAIEDVPAPSSIVPFHPPAEAQPKQVARPIILALRDISSPAASAIVPYDGTRIENREKLTGGHPVLDPCIFHCLTHKATPSTPLPLVQFRELASRTTIPPTSSVSGAGKSSSRLRLRWHHIRRYQFLRKCHITSRARACAMSAPTRIRLQCSMPPSPFSLRSSRIIA